MGGEGVSDRKKKRQTQTIQTVTGLLHLHRQTVSVVCFDVNWAGRRASDGKIQITVIDTSRARLAVRL